MSARDGGRRVTVARHGTVIEYEPPRAGGTPRRVREIDRRGDALTRLRWTPEGALDRAWLEIADGSWVMIEPRATRDAPWGLSDRLWHAPAPSAAAVPLTIFESLAYERIDRIPVLAEPARLPPGAAGTVLNLIAGLALDGGCARLTYTGPYPTEQLFLTLLESFRYDARETDPLAAFVSGLLAWSPAPYERVRLPADVTVHLRDRVEKVVWRGRPYARADWQGVERRAPRRVREAGGGVICSLWALGEVIEDHLRLDADATTVETIAPPARDAAPRPLPAAVTAGVASAAAALGAAPLASSVREIAADCELVWAPVDRDLVAVDGPRLQVSYGVHEAFVRRLRRASTRAERLALGLAMVTEMAHLLGDVLRARAQARVAALPPDAQARLLGASDAAASGGDDARRIAEAVEALLADAAGEAPEATQSRSATAPPGRDERSGGLGGPEARPPNFN